MHTVAELFRQVRAEIRTRRLLFLLIPFAVIAAGFATYPHDVDWSNRLMLHRTDALRSVARRFSSIGDYPIGTLALSVALWLAGRGMGRPRWKTAAIACLLAGSLAGFSVTMVRTLTGRPRPSAGVADGFYGPHLDHKYQSFVSAHSATSLATSTALALAAPEIGVPVLVLSLGVPWSRFYMHDHYVTDIVVGAGIGIWFGLAFGLAAISGKEPSP